MDVTTRACKHEADFNSLVVWCRPHAFMYERLHALGDSDTLEDAGHPISLCVMP